MVNIMQKPVELTLESVHNQFQLWRSKRTSKKIPDDLWELVKKLLATKRYTKTDITKTLGVSTMQLRSKFPELSSHQLPKDTSSKNSKTKTFVRVPLTPILGNAALNLTIERNDGCKLSLSIPSSQQLPAVIQAFME